MAHCVKHLGHGGHWKKSPSLSRADFKGKLTFPIAFYLSSIPSACFIFFFSPQCCSNFYPLLISLLTLIRLMSLITRWVFPKLPQQCFPPAADLQGNFVKLQIGDRRLMLSDTERFIAKCFFCLVNLPGSIIYLIIFKQASSRAPDQWGTRGQMREEGCGVSQGNDSYLWSSPNACVSRGSSSASSNCLFWGKCGVGKKRKK